MTRWRVGDYIFDADTRHLRGADRDVLLEPKTASLLAYLCEHPGRDVERDELLREVWHGQVVADNSINRVIVLLRKALQDEDKARRYITTVPKVGYRMIAEVTAVDNDARPETDLRRPPPNALWLWVALVVGLGVITVLVMNVFTRPVIDEVVPPSASIVPLSRLAVTQSNADLARDGQSLVYTASDGERNLVYLVAGPGAEPVPISAKGGDANFALWSSDGAFVVYQFVDGERCEFHRVARNGFATRSAEVLHECVRGSYTELSLSPDNTTLFFVERASAFSPYAAYALDIAGRSKRRLSQPVAQGYGNHYIDVHPDSGAVLLLSDHAPGKSSVYEMDPATDSFALRKAFDYSLDSAIWSHRDQHVVHPSKHPSYQLVETSLLTGQSRIVVSDSRRISSPRRIDNTGQTGRDYLFTSYLFNRDIDVSQAPTTSINSAVMDYLPAMSSDASRLAFVSKRSGYSQIWIRNFADESLTAIEPPDTGRRFHDLAWSGDDRHLLATTNSGILVFSFDSEEYVHDIELPLPAYAVRWHDDRTLSYSQFEDATWRAYLYSLTSGETVALDPRWAFTMRNDQQEIWFDQTLTPFRNGEAQSTLQACAFPLWRYQLRYRLDGQDTYCHAADAYGDLLRFDANLAVTRLPDAVERFEFFSVRNGRLATTRVASAHSDIMRTRHPD